MSTNIHNAEELRKTPKNFFLVKLKIGESQLISNVVEVGAPLGRRQIDLQLVILAAPNKPAVTAKRGYQPKVEARIREGMAEQIEDFFAGIWAEHMIVGLSYDNSFWG